MPKHLLSILALLLAVILAMGILQCVKPGDSAPNSASSTDEPEFSLTGEAI